MALARSNATPVPLDERERTRYNSTNDKESNEQTPLRPLDVRVTWRLAPLSKSRVLVRTCGDIAKTHVFYIIIRFVAD